MDEQFTAKILLVEDERLIAKAYVDGLSRKGFDVDWVSDGRNIEDKVREINPDVILLDLIMPVVDGFEALKILKANQELKDIPVIVLTVSGQEQDIRKVSELGAEDYLIKTEKSLHELISRIQFHLP